MHPQKRTVIVISFFAWFAFVHAFPQQNVNLDFGDSALFTTQFPRQGANRPINPMTESCLACICTASTNCNLTTQCISDGKYCGPFLISKPYWIDAGQLTIRLDQSSRDGAFFACATDPVCSSSTVRTYMQHYQTDCNNDGKIDCDDFSMLHLMGPDDCSNPRVPTTPFYKRFKTCHEKVLELSGS